MADRRNLLNTNEIALEKQNCSRKYEQSTKFWLKVWREWNMMFTLRIIAYKS